MLSTPCVPPVRSAHSISTLCTMMPKAMVTIARYGPSTSSAGSATSTPMTAARRMATGNATQNATPSFVASSAPVYAPTA